MLLLALALHVSPVMPIASMQDDDKIDVRTALKTFGDAFSADDAADRITALATLQTIQQSLPEPDARITKALGTAFKKGEDFGVKAAAARHLAVAHDPGDALAQLDRAMKAAARDLASVGFEDPQHAASHTWLKTLFQTLGAYRDDRAQKQLILFFTKQRMILHGEALDSLAQALLDYECMPSLEAVLEYQAEAEKTGFSRMLRNRIKASLKAMAKERSIDAPPELADGRSYAETLGRWLKKHSRHFDKRLGRLKEPRKAS